MNSKIIIIGLAAVLLAGCMTPASKINGVALGMTKEQVNKIMGPPASITADREAEYLNYALAEFETWGAAATTTPYEIKLVNGKVESYGRAGAPNSQHPVPMPVIMPAVHH